MAIAYRKVSFNKEVRYIRLRTLSKNGFDKSPFWDYTVIKIGETYSPTMYRYTIEGDDYDNILNKYEKISSIEWKAARRNFNKQIDSKKQIPFEEVPF